MRGQWTKLTSHWAKKKTVRIYGFADIANVIWYVVSTENVKKKKEPDVIIFGNAVLVDAHRLYCAGLLLLLLLRTRIAIMSFLKHNNNNLLRVHSKTGWKPTTGGGKSGGNIVLNIFHLVQCVNQNTHSQKGVEQCHRSVIPKRCFRVSRQLVASLLELV